MARFRGDLPARTFEFGVQVVSITDTFPSCNKTWVLGKQLLRSGTSIGANIQEANHALTDAEVTHRCSIARKETSETAYWLRLCVAVGLVQNDPVATLLKETDELLSILTTIIRKSQNHIANS